MPEPGLEHIALSLSWRFHGLVSAEKSGGIVDALWKKMEAAGFRRFDLGVPPMLVPVLHADYLQPNAIGMSHKQDGTDTFGVNSRGSSGFHQRCLKRATLGRRQSYGMPRNLPVPLISSA